MDSFELTKIAAAVLMALLVIFGVRTFIDIRASGHGGAVHHAGYTLPVAEAPAGGEQKDGGHAPAAPAFDAAAVATAAASGNAEAGQGVSKKCTACHTFESGGANKIGPHLFGVVGRPKAAVEGFSYSDDMKAKGGNWALADLAMFLHDPKAYVPKTKMVFAGLKDTNDLANLLAYLSTLK